MPNQGAAYWEKEISDVIESLKRFQNTLSEGRSAIIENVFNFQPSKEYEKEKCTSGDGLKDSMAEIEKMDNLLRMKNMEEKKAKLSRLQVEEESRSILTNLTSDTMPTRIKMNSNEFLRLLCETGKLDTDNSDLGSEEITKEDDAKEGKKPDDGEEKNFKPTGSHHKLKFVEKNIRLAKCGRGVLSLTDEENLRIESLLIDMVDPRPEVAKKQKIENSTKPDFYAFNEEWKSILSELDQRLEVFSKDKQVQSSRLSLLENLKVEENMISETGNKKTKKNPPNELVDINKLLNRLNSITDEEINPLSPEDINQLIEGASKSIVEVEPKPSPEVIADLVSGAKVLMPKFKYRFDES